MSFIGKIRKYSYSKVVTIPPLELEALGLDVGDMIVVRIQKLEKEKKKKVDVSEDYY